MSLSPHIAVIYILVFTAGALAMHALIGAGNNATLRVRLANARLRRLKSHEDDAVLSIVKKQKQRNLDGSGEFDALINWINTLVIQSAAPLGRYGIYIILAVLPLILAAGLGLWRESYIFAALGLAAGLALPILALKQLVKRRRAKLGAQLPEALDVIIRSLGAGHPVPVAMGMVSSEMAEPIRGEFKITSDEVSFGASLGEGVQRMAERIGHQDFELFAATVRLQERTGGNLAELLRSNAQTVRARIRMRLKIRAATAEGRMSAMILNVAPLLLYAAVRLTSPGFYGEVADDPLMKMGFAGAAVWMLIGNLIMRKMINFRI